MAFLFIIPVYIFLQLNCNKINNRSHLTTDHKGFGKEFIVTQSKKAETTLTIKLQHRRAGGYKGKRKL